MDVFMSFKSLLTGFLFQSFSTNSYCMQLSCSEANGSHLCQEIQSEFLHSRKPIQWYTQNMLLVYCWWYIPMISPWYLQEAAACRVSSLGVVQLGRPWSEGPDMATGSHVSRGHSTQIADFTDEKGDFKKQTEQGCIWDNDMVIW